MGYKKWLGGAGGWILSGFNPLWGILGFAFGALLDNATVEVVRKEMYTGKETTPESDFRLSLRHQGRREGIKRRTSVCTQFFCAPVWRGES
jgi:hypothetical protein